MSWWRDLLGLPAVETKAAATTTIEALLRSGGATPSGVPMNRETALTVPVVLACLRVIAEGVAQVPWRLYRTTDTGREEARDHPLWDIAALQPNEFQTSFDFRETKVMHAALMGAGYSMITRAQDGSILELLPLPPELVQAEQQVDWTIRYRVTKPRGGFFEVPESEMWHFRGPSWNGWQGLNLVAQARDALGLAKATEQFGSQFFGNGARPSGIIKPDNGVTYSQEQAAAAKQNWLEAMGGGSQLGVAFLNGLQYQAITTVPEEAQFSETRAAQVIEICRVFRVNPVMVMQQDKAATYASSEQMFLAHLVHTLGPWFARFLQSADRALLTREERRQGLHFMLDDRALMRGAAAERAGYHEKMLVNGVVSVNEVRRVEGMEPLDGDEFDKPRAAANLYGDPKAAAEPAPAEPAVASEPLHLHVKVDSPVTVHTPPVSFKADAPHVTVEAPQVTVQPAEVKVEAPHVTVQHMRGGRLTKSVEYDGDGNVARIVEDEAE